MSSDLRLTLLELVRRLNGNATIESGRLPGGRRRSPDTTTGTIGVTKTTEDPKECTDPTSRPAPEGPQEEPLHDLRPRPANRKGAAVE
uniref:X protein n=1 Tax=Borna disease virus 1 TaxID=1714621 RepID=Q9WNA1_BDV1|nr:p10 protein [Borna disease virus 1]AAR36919.1 X protein [Borna disease virus 1]AAR36931.1 X protein [Borna disease virus 1]AAR36949.1 X protein [Borna disease virus 1]AAR36952.1 X protein [Borna disease virus 1]